MHAFWLENQTLMMRWIYQLRRQPLTIATTLVQPVLWLVLFGNLFRNIAGRADLSGGDYLTFITAGAVVMTIFNSAVMGGVELLFDREHGFLDRLLAAPINRLSIVISRFTYVVGLSTAQSLIIVITAYLLGVRFTTGLLGIAMSLAVGALFGAGIATLSIVLAFTCRHHPEFFSITAFITLPVIFVSTALAPLDVMPDWLRTLAQLNPMTYAIEAVRQLVIDGWDWSELGRMVSALLLFDALALLLAARVLHYKQ